ncbi:LAMI_0H04456g1_1 [Lachancea mirantina]|uniref:LAMI_0H04456g1_1 n=1 Tax=Lachancea mirantina TaxID=1230905 RepID=A0A1G4KEU8_9SACH|nr:LAMI_0H04456g1_1 [Lachancea mirantina]
MEKFTEWRDQGTGVPPFLPAMPSLSQEKGFRGFYHNCVALGRLTIASPFLILAVIVGINRISKSLVKFGLVILCNWNLQVSIQGVRRTEQRSVHMPQKNHMYMVNYSSPLDCVALWFLADGPVKFCIASDVQGSSLVELGIWQFFKFTLQGSLPEGSDFGRKVTKFSNLQDKVVFVFPEGTCSNGKSVLGLVLNQQSLDQFLDENDDAREIGVSTGAKHTKSSVPVARKKVQTIQLKIKSTLATPLSLGLWKYLVRMTTQGVTYKCKISEPIPADLDDIRVSLAGGDKFKLVNRKLNLRSKRAFVKAYGERRR